jgi:hypothetical protein
VSWWLLYSNLLRLAESRATVSWATVSWWLLHSNLLRLAESWATVSCWLLHSNLRRLAESWATVSCTSVRWWQLDWVLLGDLGRVVHSFAMISFTANFCSSSNISVSEMVWILLPKTSYMASSRGPFMLSNSCYRSSLLSIPLWHPLNRLHWCLNAWNSS